MTWLRRMPLFGRLFGPGLSGPAHAAAVHALVERCRQFGLLVDLEPRDLARRFAEQRQRPFDPGSRDDLPWWLAMDAKHVWMDDTEADVCAENQVYSEFLREWLCVERPTRGCRPRPVAKGPPANPLRPAAGSSPTAQRAGRASSQAPWYR